MAATGLTVAATARRRPKTPGGDRAEKGLTGKVGPKAPAWWAGREGWPRKGAQAVSRPRREAPRAGPVGGARKRREEWAGRGRPGREGRPERAQRESPWSPGLTGGAGTARVPASRGPQRGGGHGPNRGGEGRPNGPATASSGRTGGGVPGPRNREMGSPELPAGGSRAVAGRACGPGRTRISGREAHPYRGTPLSPTPG